MIDMLWHTTIIPMKRTSEETREKSLTTTEVAENAKRSTYQLLTTVSTVALCRRCY